MIVMLSVGCVVVAMGVVGGRMVGCGCGVGWGLVGGGQACLHKQDKSAP